MKSVPTFTAFIYLGLEETDVVYGFRTDELHDLRERKFSACRDLCQEYVNEVGLCVSVAKTEFVYSHGHECGAVIGLINYPRFPKPEQDIRATALDLAQKLKTRFRQKRVSIVFTDETIMIGNPE